MVPPVPPKESYTVEFVHMVMDRLHAVEEGLQNCESELVGQKRICKAFMNATASYISRYTTRFHIDVTADMITKTWVEEDPLRYESVQADDVYIEGAGQTNPVLRISRFEIALRMGWIDVARRIIDAYPEMQLSDDMAILGDGTVWTAEMFARHPSPNVPEETRAALGDLIRSRKTT